MKRSQGLLKRNQDYSSTVSSGSTGFSFRQLCYNTSFIWLTRLQDLIIAENGYPAESHIVTTEDCYILEMHRIPFGKNSPIVSGEVRPAVFLQHGLLCSSADWVIPYPAKGLGKLTNFLHTESLGLRMGGPNVGPEAFLSVLQKMHWKKSSPTSTIIVKCRIF